MALRSPIYLAGAFLVLALAYSAYFNVAVRVDPAAAQARFDWLLEHNAQKRAAIHGERALRLRSHEGETAEDLAATMLQVADAQFARKKYERATVLYRDALATNTARTYSDRKRARYEDKLANAALLSGDIETAVAIYASFLELAGDDASRGIGEDPDALSSYYVSRASAAGSLFAEAVNYARPYIPSTGSREEQLAVANHMASLGAFFTMQNDGAYAAAGLLSSAYHIREKLLGGDHQDTVQLTLVLGPVYTSMGRLDDAEKLYLDAFHAQEEVKGANSPDLSLYIKLLTSVYEKQGRLTEAQALQEHMRRLFRDAFGAQRYSANQERDRREDINRPVSQNFVLQSNYAPGDLVSAAEFSIPTSKSPNIDEMKLRLAGDQNADPREANMPARLAQLISLCRSESGERISLRSGYRSYATQRILYERNLDRGTVTPPGMSEHQTGLAADINVNDRFMRQSDRSFQCFEENAYRFGFILSYPPENNYLPGDDPYEPWHWRYVGVRTAHLYREAGPHHKPQEFLAALPCYEERAANGIFPTIGEEDICLSSKPLTTVSLNESVETQPEDEGDNSARILNKLPVTRQPRR
ncbi:D-alanyl-D-alanine carboxypeptidase family protein [Hyphococcus flavus]|uniref:D-alanyl-D-alanine carboxypeptidase family protein n=1 Tax=Hyphococcus flavus TaxID=1866326 RepID=A0AAE9ZEE5_9PROT|nr:D-alanyl-D-alanine carboxypeptidase family protein [Hyphococcus flavus]WDI31082.1 D-alanyl-D-alanine carboxypeptidase family protein [Hyphococcus flavus]